MDRSPVVELTPQETLALIQVANAGGVRAGTVSESDLSRLHALGLVEQRGISTGLTATGIQTIARPRSGWRPGCGGCRRASPSIDGTANTIP